LNSLNYQVISSVCDWLEQGNRIFFITVLNTWGASPRPVGSLFAFNIDKLKQVGSLSGGCIEEDLTLLLLQKSSELKEDRHAFLKIYGAQEGDSERYLLPCGGTLELLIEPLFDQQQLLHYLQIKTSLAAHKPIARVVNFSSSEFSYALNTDKKIQSQSCTLTFDRNKLALFHRLDPVYLLLIVGAGDVAFYLSELAQSLDFKVTICEPRKQYAQRLVSLDNSADIQYCLPDDLIRADFLEENSAIICLAHDPKVDDMALIEALTNSKAFYIGAMGSKKTTENRVQRLKRLGIDDKQLKRLHAPIGINIHSKTPQEIAISIVAQLIAIRHTVKLSGES
jgi:xanthine dehydrogenase accessory factor